MNEHEDSTFDTMIGIFIFLLLLALALYFLGNANDGKVSPPAAPTTTRVNVVATNG